MSAMRDASEEGERAANGQSLGAPPSGLPSDLSESSDDVRPPHRRRPSVFWPLVLVGVGVVTLLSNLGYIPWQSWNALWRLWPLLLVAIGIDLLIGRRSLAGAIVSALVILTLIGAAVLVALFAQNVPILTDWAQPTDWQAEHIEHPLQGVERAAVAIDWSTVPAYLGALADRTNLVEADLDYRGRLIFDVDVHGSMAEVRLDTRLTAPWFGSLDPRGSEDRRWDVRLSPDVRLDLTLDVGSGPSSFDLTGLQVDSLALDAGSGPTDLVLPAGSTFRASVDGGSGPIRITVPESVGAAVVLDSGSGPFDPDGRFRLVEGKQGGDGVWETSNFYSAEHTVSLELDQGSGPVTIR